MKNRNLLILFGLLLTCTFLRAQDASFTQWESFPLNFNPALTGDFEGLMRVRGKYRNQWESILGEYAYRTHAVSAEYNFKDGNNRRVSIGAFGITDVAGRSRYRTNNLQISGAVNQYLGNKEARHHEIGIGFSAGWGNQSFKEQDMYWMDTIFIGNSDATNYADLSAGLHWQYQGRNHFQVKAGYGLHHINRADISFENMLEDRFYLRHAAHVQVEVPLHNAISILPSALYQEQGPSNEILFGMEGRWYFLKDGADYLQLGCRARATNSFSKDIELNTYIITATVVFKSVLVGFAWDRHTGFYKPTNAYEFTVGYVLGRR